MAYLDMQRLGQDISDAGLPNRSDFCGKGPDADLFGSTRSGNGPEITKIVQISELKYDLWGLAVKICD